MTCECWCSNCKGTKCHYSGYHCKHWVREYGDLEAYGVCLLKVLEDRGRMNGVTGPEQQRFHDDYMRVQVPWYTPPRRY